MFVLVLAWLAPAPEAMGSPGRRNRTDRRRDHWRGAGSTAVSSRT
jgi:hypothetical protein